MNKKKKKKERKKLQHVENEWGTYEKEKETKKSYKEQFLKERNGEEDLRWWKHWLRLFLRYVLYLFLFRKVLPTVSTIIILI